MTKRSCRYQQGFQQLLSIAAPIHCPDATALRVRPDQIDTGRHFRAFADELLSLSRVQFPIKRNDFTGVHFGPSDIAQPVARMPFAGSGLRSIFSGLTDGAARVTLGVCLSGYAESLNRT